MNNFFKKNQPSPKMLTIFMGLLLICFIYIVLTRDFSGPVFGVFSNLFTGLIFLSCTYYVIENINEKKRNAAKTLWYAELREQTHALIDALKATMIKSNASNALVVQQATKAFCSTVLNSADFLDREEVEILFSLIYVDLNKLPNYLKKVDKKKVVLKELDELDSLLTKKLKSLVEVKNRMVSQKRLALKYCRHLRQECGKSEHLHPWHLFHKSYPELLRKYKRKLY